MVTFSLEGRRLGDSSAFAHRAPLTAVDSLVKMIGQPTTVTMELKSGLGSGMIGHIFKYS